MDRGHVRAIATDLTARGKGRIWRCQRGATTVSAPRAPVVCDRRTSEATVRMAVKRLVGGVQRSGLAWGLGRHAATVLAWRVRAAAHAHALHAPGLRERPVTPGQRAAMGQVLARQPAPETAAAGARVAAGAEGRPWGGVGLAPACRWLRAAVVGPRPLDTAPAGGAGTQARGAGLPAGGRDGCTGERAALLAAGPVVPTWARPGPRGRPRPPVGEPPPARVDALGVHPPQPGQRRTRSRRVGRGAERRTHRGRTRSTAVVARVHRTRRPAVAPWARQTSSVGTDRERRRPRVVCWPAFCHGARPPMRVRRPGPRRARPRHGASRPRGRARTLAMAAGVTDHVCTVRELLPATFEPWDSQRMSR